MITSMYMRMKTMEQKYVLSASLTKSGAKTTHHDVEESSAALSTLRSRADFKTIRDRISFLQLIINEFINHN